ncbi:AbrB family transcriptional regulator [Macrococcus lamae]|uniref:AbrB family transcriptional regulator n=1 Tax=Macrococcus lamae TaxID=198484 RepID=A0A4R6BX16_9STAP|nr:AbrB family transcriptional regulator [Macrococcus lamae]TDM13022.1 AbrB family transcriptional regulator [Macrococcus lamae]
MVQVLLIVSALLAGFILMKVGMILPWLFGPIIAAVLFSKVSNKKATWPHVLGDAGLFILGAQIGATFTNEVVMDIKNDILNIIILNIMILLAAVALSLLFARIVDCSFETALLSSIPGALSQMIVMAEENEKASLLVVTLSQTSRLLFVIMIVPLISSLHHSGSSSHPVHRQPVIFEALEIWTIIGLIIAMLLVCWLMTKIHLPVPQLLAPILVIIIWNLITDVTFSTPYFLIAIAQVMFGVRIGLQMYSLSSQLSKRLFIGILIQNMMLIFVTLLIVILFTWITVHPFNDLFLSAAPGGMAQIIIVGLETRANVAMISSYHIFRIFFILLIVAPFVQYILKARQIDKSI